MKLFTKILIANRGEIAVRIIRAARDLGVQTVAVYSVADKEALHVEMADEAYCFGESLELSETYLNIQKLIGFATNSGCEAIHPGYGFLAENPDLVSACEANNLVFIGPNTRAIQLMGNKIESRKFVKELGIPMTEAKTGNKASLMKAATEIPFPLLIKAAAGGGGKGMRIVHSKDELDEAIENTSREAKNYFSDGTVFVEKYVEEPRHIEIQVLGDNYGNVVHLFERECSIQRRYQKIIEESPSPTLTPEVREKMGEAAVMISKEIGYSSAGTVEFLVDKNLDFYFLEMNTRVQVEHPVTEMVTNIDIVREQILVAAGNKLDLQQDEIHQHGHAIECRIYAEDPSNNFLPSPGQMSFYQEPQGENIRVDSGIKEASTIQSFYDPMISKLVVWGIDREAARVKSIEALKEYVIHGVKTNISYLTELLRNEAYIENKITTKYCDEHTDDIVELISNDRNSISFQNIAASYLIYSLNEDLLYSDHEEENIWNEIGFWRDFMEVAIKIDGEEYPVKINDSFNGEYEFEIGKLKIYAVLESMELGILELFLNDAFKTVYISDDGKGKGFLTIDGHIFNLERKDILIEEDIFSNAGGEGKDEGEIVSPMPGKVIKMNIKEGDEVKKGNVLLIVEAMKMENNIISSRDGIVEKVNVKEGDMVDGSLELVVLGKL